jgi:hypothetical protein
MFDYITREIKLSVRQQTTLFAPYRINVTLIFLKNFNRKRLFSFNVVFISFSDYVGWNQGHWIWCSDRVLQQDIELSEICIFHGNDYKYCCLPVYSASLPWRNVP